MSTPKQPQPPTVKEQLADAARTVFGPSGRRVVLPAAQPYSKYGAKPTEFMGLRFASRAEARRAAELDLLERAKEIRGLCRQVRFPLVVNGVKVTTYVCDFQYVDVVTGAKVVEDVKGVRTREYLIKKKLMRALYEIEIREVQA